MQFTNQFLLTEHYLNFPSMPKFQKLSKDGNITTFRVISDDGVEEVRSSICLPGESEEQMMSRHAHHHNDELAKAKAEKVAEPGVEKTALSKNSLPIKP